MGKSTKLDLPLVDPLLGIYQVTGEIISLRAFMLKC